MAAQNPGVEELRTPRISRGFFFFAVFFRVTRDGLGERGTTRVYYCLSSLLTVWEYTCLSLSVNPQEKLDIQQKLKIPAQCMWS